VLAKVTLSTPGVEKFHTVKDFVVLGKLTDVSTFTGIEFSVVDIFDAINVWNLIC
jgi:hypothetical protein